METSTLRPGLLVSIRTSLIGGVQYDKQDIERDHLDDDGNRVAKWQTERRIAAPEEFEAAKRIQNKTRSLIATICAKSAFGLLCPDSKTLALEAAVTEARRIADDFNRKARNTRVYFYCITGRIAPDDAEAIRAITGEMRDLITDMMAGVKNLDAKAIRDAANRARSVGQMLSPQAQERIQEAIETARSKAREIVKAGEQAAIEVDKKVVRRLTELRTAFLDLDEGQTVAKPKASRRAVDLDPQTPVRQSPLVRPRRSLDLA